MNQAAPKETACPDCGEMVRLNSLRCWNCGGFMNPEVEQRFLAMQANPRPTIFSEVPEGEDSPEEGDADDFQLKTPLARPIVAQSLPSIVPDQVKMAPAVSEVDESDIDGPPIAPAAKAARTAAPEPDVAHSVATGGDALLDIARQEEREGRKKSKGKRTLGGMRTPGGGLIIYCPYGCRVEVKETHRGMTGRCPRCQAPFIVPTDPPRFKEAKSDVVAETAAGAPADLFRVWLTDLHLHTVDPAKLKLKADSLLKEFIEVDIGFSPDVLLVASLNKKAAAKGMFAKGSGEKKEDVRAALVAFLAEKKPPVDAPTGDKYLFDAMDLPQLKVVQPASDRATSMFHGVPVFGTHRIAVQLPLTEKTEHPIYLSMGITEFWKFAKAMEEIFHIPDLNSGLGLPNKVRGTTLKCHFLDTPIKVLEDVELFKADPSAQLEVAGYQCGSCKVAVSEAGRKKENLGGKSPKGIAKAKCPKCGQKMGENLLYSLKDDMEEPSMAASAT